jgi:hypothetical protein
MTSPSGKLDCILRSGKIPKIEAVVDVRKYKYVWNRHEDGIQVGDWFIPMVYGFLSDGATLVWDFHPDGYFAHDMLYARPKALYKNTWKNLSKRQCDMIYARIGLKHRNPIVFFRGVFLSTGVNNCVWKGYRHQDQSALLRSKLVPHAQCWLFETTDTRDAVWIG